MKEKVDIWLFNLSHLKLVFLSFIYEVIVGWGMIFSDLYVYDKIPAKHYLGDVFGKDITITHRRVYLTQRVRFVELLITEPYRRDRVYYVTSRNKMLSIIKYHLDLKRPSDKLNDITELYLRLAAS